MLYRKKEHFSVENVDKNIHTYSCYHIFKCFTCIQVYMQTRNFKKGLYYIIRLKEVLLIWTVLLKNLIIKLDNKVNTLFV